MPVDEFCAAASRVFRGAAVNRMSRSMRKIWAIILYAVGLLFIGLEALFFDDAVVKPKKRRP